MYTVDTSVLFDIVYLPGIRSGVLSDFLNYKFISSIRMVPDVLKKKKRTVRNFTLYVDMHYNDDK